MNLNDIKDLCKEHNELLEKTKVIEKCNKERLWVKVITPNRGEFYLGDKEIKLLSDYYEKRGSEIEEIMFNLLDKK